MLKDLRELFEEEDDEFETFEDARRRTYLVAGAIGGGFLLLILLCFAGYALLIGPRRSSARQTEVAENQTQIAVISEQEAGGPKSEDQAADNQTAAPTRTRVPSPTSSPTEPPLSTPTILVTDTPTPRPLTPTPSPTTTPTSEPTTTPEIVFREDFEGSGGAWPSEDKETYTFGIADGGFRIYVNTFFADIWTVRDREFTDVRMELDVTKISGPNDGYAGLICRFQNSGNYYGFIVMGDGGYRIYKKFGGIITDLETPGQKGIVETGDSFNRIRADCTGTSLTLFVNGERVADAQDDTFTEGRVGLVAGTEATPGLEILFDNFLIANP